MLPRQAEYVWLIDEGVRAEVINYGAYVSVVRYTLSGHVHEVVVSNDEFNIIGEEGNDDED